MNASNPFILKGYISPEYFCDRESETEFLKQSALNARNLVLFSKRRMGKTGLIFHLKHTIRRQNYKFIYCDIMMANSIQDFTYHFGKAVINQALSFRQKSLQVISNLFSSFVPVLVSEPLTGQMSFELKPNNRDFLISDIDKLFNLLKESKYNYIIAIDEFQQILNFEDKGFEAYLRSKIQFLNNCSFIFSGSRKGMLLAMFNDAKRPFWQSSAFMELKAIEKSTYSEFIINNLMKAKKEISSDAIDRIFELSAGITYYVQLICHQLYLKRANKIGVSEVNTIFEEIVRENEDFYLNYIQLFTQTQLRLLKAIAMENGVAKITSSEFLQKYNLGAASTVKSAIDKFLEKDIVSYENETYQLTDLLFSEWLKRT